MKNDKLAAFYSHLGQDLFQGYVPVGTIGGAVFQGLCGYSEKDALAARLLEIENRIKAIEARMDSDSDTRPKDGDAQQGSARE
jgi:hypothetical protein